MTAAVENKAKIKSSSSGGKSKGSRKKYCLKLYIAGQTPKSLAAISNLKRICEEHLKGEYEIKVIDLIKNPKLAQGDQILAIPTLVRKVPAPVKRILGDLSDTEKVLVGFDLKK